MLKYSDTHEWVDLKDGIATIGVTDYAQKELGDIVYVELPKVGKAVKAGEEAAVLESTKAAADVYSPLSGTIVEVNQQLTTASELVNRSPEEQGWLFKLKPADLKEFDGLLDEKAYKAKLGSKN